MQAPFLTFPLLPLAGSAGWVTPKNKAGREEPLTSPPEQVLHAPSHLVQPHRGALRERLGAAALHQHLEGCSLRGRLRRMRRRLPREGAQKDFTNSSQISGKATTGHTVIHRISKAVQHSSLQAAPGAFLTAGPAGPGVQHPLHGAQTLHSFESNTSRGTECPRNSWE